MTVCERRLVSRPCQHQIRPLQCPGEPLSVHTSISCTSRAQSKRRRSAQSLAVQTLTGSDFQTPCLLHASKAVSCVVPAGMSKVKVLASAALCWTEATTVPSCARAGARLSDVGMDGAHVPAPSQSVAGDALGSAAASGAARTQAQV